jgi:hypothetical protein
MSWVSVMIGGVAERGMFVLIINALDCASTEAAVDGHLVAVEVGVEREAHQRV